MPVTKLFVEGKMDEELLASVCQGKPLVVGLKCSKNALAPRTLTERANVPAACYLRDRDFDYKPLTDTSGLCVDKYDDKGNIVGWRWHRHSIENYLLEPAIVCSATRAHQHDYLNALHHAADKLKYYQAARWTIGLIRSVLPPYYELQTFPDNVREYQLPNECDLDRESSRKWTRQHIARFSEKILPHLDNATIHNTFDEHAKLFSEENALSTETILVYFSGKDLISALNNWSCSVEIANAKALLHLLRNWVIDNPKESLDALPEWRLLLDTMRQ